MDSVEECIPGNSAPHERFLAPIGIPATLAHIDLLLTQAITPINQNVFRHFRRCSMERLKAGAAGMLPMPSRRAGSAAEFERDTAFAECSPVWQLA